MWFGTASGPGCVGESSGYFALSVESQAGDQRPCQYAISTFKTDKVGATTVDGIAGLRIAGHFAADPGMGPEAGTTVIRYQVFNGKRTYCSEYQRRPSEPDYSLVFDELMQQTFRFAPWSAYRSDKDGYKLDYPASWYALSNLGAPDSERYFANAKNIGSPIGMDSSGALFALSVLTGPCRTAPPGSVDSTVKLTVDGQTATRVSGFMGPPQSEAFWSSYVSLPSGSRCFQFAFVFGSKSARDANLVITDQIVTSFSTK